ncbi:MAG: serine hydrolase domain-containing protein [Bacteroidia bacterium]
MTRLLFFTILLFYTAIQSAQVNSILNTQESIKIKTNYNNKKYSAIYELLNPGMKKIMTETEFCDFMQKNIFAYHGMVEKFEFLKDDGGHSEFIGHFTKGELLMKINVDSTGLIELLQFLPYQGMPKLKITAYGTDNKKLNKQDSLIDRLVIDYMQSPQNCGLSIGIYNNGKEYFYNCGETKRATKVLPTSSTIYEIGSVTKVFCGILLANAIAEKKVKATDDIRLYLPQGKYKNLATKDNYIQLIQLANHTSGLPRLPANIDTEEGYDPFNPYKHYTKDMTLKYLETISLATEPGTVCEYSNLGMGLLGIILENIYNKSFEDLVKEKICKPLGMHNTGINLTKEQEALFAPGYNSNGNETPHWELPGLPAAGAIRSTMKNMLLFAEKNLDEKDEALKLSHQSTFNEGSNVAMAWQILKTKAGNTLIWHNGATYGSSSFVGFLKEKNCAVVVLSNSGTTVDPIALAILRFLQQ